MLPASWGGRRSSLFCREQEPPRKQERLFSPAHPARFRGGGVEGSSSSIFTASGPCPGEIVVSPLPAGSAGLAGLFSEGAGRAPGENSRRPAGRAERILDLARKNLALFVQKSDFRRLWEDIQSSLRLRNFPARIEGYDISHLGERNRVGARVVFRDGRPEKRLYRSYIIRAAAPGDTEALKEVLRRRFAGWNSELPDLLLIDGGLPQLGTARQVKARFGLSCDLLALAKGEERVFLEDGTSQVSDQPGTLARHLLQNVRDEVHRRAIGHHRRRREKLPG